VVGRTVIRRARKKARQKIRDASQEAEQLPKIETCACEQRVAAISGAAFEPAFDLFRSRLAIVWRKMRFQPLPIDQFPQPHQLMLQIDEVPQLGPKQFLRPAVLRLRSRFHPCSPK
jgi:hypothetical protein